MMEINLVTTVGLDPILLHHFIKHYKSLGVDNIYIVVWGDSKKVKYDETVNVLKTHDLEVYKDLRDVENGDPQFLTDIYNEVISTKPDDWWIVADLDEFAVFPKPLEQFIYEDLMYNDVDFVYGIMLDRIGENGEFSELTYDDNIWKKFPNVGLVNHCIRGNNNMWCGLLKGKYELNVGQHSLKGELLNNWPLNPLDIDKVKVQVHNFTWKKSDIKKVKYYTKLWKPTKICPEWIDEYVRVDDYLKENKKINISDSRFLIERCPNNKFNSYLKWKDVFQLSTDIEEWTPLLD